MEGKSDIVAYQTSSDLNPHNHPGTMNFKVRLSEAQRIHNKNLILAQRLNNMTAYYKESDIKVVRPVKIPNTSLKRRIYHLKNSKFREGSPSDSLRKSPNQNDIIDNFKYDDEEINKNKKNLKNKKYENNENYNNNSSCTSPRNSPKNNQIEDENFNIDYYTTHLLEPISLGSSHIDKSNSTIESSSTLTTSTTVRKETDYEGDKERNRGRSRANNRSSRDTRRNPNMNSNNKYDIPSTAPAGSSNIYLENNFNLSKSSSSQAYSSDNKINKDDEFSLFDRQLSNNIIIECNKIQNNSLINIIILKEPFRDSYIIFGKNIQTNQKYELQLNSEDIINILDGDIIVSSFNNINLWLILIEKIELLPVEEYTKVLFKMNNEDNNSQEINENINNEKLLNNTICDQYNPNFFSKIDEKLNDKESKTSPRYPTAPEKYSRPSSQRPSSRSVKNSLICREKSAQNNDNQKDNNKINDDINDDGMKKNNSSLLSDSDNNLDIKVKTWDCEDDYEDDYEETEDDQSSLAVTKENKENSTPLPPSNTKQSNVKTTSRPNPHLKSKTTTNPPINSSPYAPKKPVGLPVKNAINSRYVTKTKPSAPVTSTTSTSISGNTSTTSSSSTTPNTTTASTTNKKTSINKIFTQSPRINNIKASSRVQNSSNNSSSNNRNRSNNNNISNNKKQSNFSPQDLQNFIQNFLQPIISDALKNCTEIVLNKNKIKNNEEEYNYEEDFEENTNNQTSKNNPDLFSYTNNSISYSPPRPSSSSSSSSSNPAVVYSTPAKKNGGTKDFSETSSPFPFLNESFNDTTNFPYHNEEIEEEIH